MKNLKSKRFENAIYQLADDRTYFVIKTEKFELRYNKVIDKCVTDEGVAELLDVLFVRTLNLEEEMDFCIKACTEFENHSCEGTFDSACPEEEEYAELPFPYKSLDHQ